MVAVLVAYDAEVVENIPASASLILAYIDGAVTSQNYAQARARFPGAAILPITTIGTPAARICDGERLDMSPSAVAVWARREIVNARRPTGYWSVGNRAPYLDALSNAGITTGTTGQMDRLEANYSGGPVIPNGDVGIQWATGNFDQSLVLASWVSPAKLPGNIDVSPGMITPTQEEEVVKVFKHTVNGGGYVIVWPNGTYTPVADGPSGSAFTEAYGVVNDQVLDAAQLGMMAPAPGARAI